MLFDTHSGANFSYLAIIKKPSFPKNPKTWTFRDTLLFQLDSMVNLTQFGEKKF